MPSLSQRVAHSSLWLAGSRLVVRSIGLISTLILARLLTPDDFGIVALASAFYFVIQTLSDLRFEQALISLRDTSDADFDTAWSMNTIRGGGIALILLLGAYPYAALMDDMRLVGVMLLVALIPVIDGLRNPRFIMFEKAMDLRREFVLQVTTKLAGFFVTITLTLIYREYWTLIVGNIAATLASVAMTYRFARERPRFSLASFRRLINFSGWLMGGQLVTAVLGRAQLFLVGAYLPAAKVGVLHVGSEIANMATHEVLTPIRRALLPALAHLSGDEGNHRKAFRYAMTSIVGLALPIGLGIVMLADRLVPLLLGDQWLGAIDVMRFVAVVGALSAISSMGDTVLISKGHTKPLFRRELLKLAYVIPGLWIGIRLGGFEGLLIAWLVVAHLELAVNLDMLRRHTGVNPIALLAASWRSVLAVAGMVAALWGSMQVLPPPGSGLGSDIASVAALIVIGALTYGSLHLALWLAAGKPDGFEARALHIVGGLRKRS